VDYGNTGILLTGDVGKATEERLMASGGWLAAEALKVAHHGSKNATGRAFLEQVRPQWALIGCGAANRYGHPHPRVLGDLAAVGARVCRTDRDGAVILHSDGDSLWQVNWR
jgi:competence protein ComEC